jgi:NADH-quinone oxidoreductase subunit J
METVMFVILGVIAVVAAVSVIVQKRVVYSALSLLLNLCALAGLYILLNAEFIAIVQVIVYAGAIVVLFLFGIMLLDVDWEDFKAGKRGWLRYPAIVFAAILLAQVAYMLSSGVLSSALGPYTPEMMAQQGNVWMLGRALFTDFLIPFELASVLLLSAIVGAVFLGEDRPQL